MQRWKDRLAVVTGASGGIGEDIAKRLAKQGLRVAAIARRAGKLQELEKEAKGGSGSIKGYQCDVANSEEVLATFAKIEKELGPIDILVCNAGVLREVNCSDMDLAKIEELLATNVMGVLQCAKAALASMKKNNVQDGHIIAIGSMAAHWEAKDWPSYGMYGVSKTAITKAMRNLKYQLTKDGSKIRITTVSPGLVETEMTSPVIPDFSKVSHLKSQDITSAVEYVLSLPAHVNISEIMVEPV